MDGNTLDSLLRIMPIGLFGLLSWSIWLFRRILSHRAPQIDTDYSTTVSVVIPVYREDATVLLECLDTWLAQEPDEIILVVDVEDHECLARLRELASNDTVVVVPFKHRGKRSALGVGIRAAKYAIVVLADSDTAWTPGLLREVQKPFADERVGGVGTRQVVAGRVTSIWRRLASWLLDIRFLDYVPAMGARGGVPCLSGRTAAYRREVITPLLPQLEHEIFFGKECVAGDDGRLTWLVLSQGFRTVHQRSAVAVSMFPDTFRAFTKQRIRWSRNSYRCYLTAAWRGWLWHQPFVTQVTVLQILLTPLTMGIAIGFLVLAVHANSAIVATLLVIWVFAGRAIRGISHLEEHPRDIWILPLVVVMTAYIALPIKFLALVTMNRQGWLTRKSDQVGGEGQDNASMADHGIVE